MCPDCKASARLCIKKGFYKSQSSKKKRIQRYFCKNCKKYFSEQNTTIHYRDKKPHLNQLVFRFACSGMSQRRIAINLGINRKTVAAKIIKLGRFAALQQHHNLIKKSGTIHKVIFDEMETFEHSKCKPVSIEVMVEEKTRFIIGLKAAKMPAKGLLAKVSRKRYGRRRDDRPAAMKKLFTYSKGFLPPVFSLKSDESPRYPHRFRTWLAGGQHKAYKGLRGCVVGQGELKASGRDPLFSLNHTCAMTRDNLKTLTRRTWCTMKCPKRFQCLLNLYMIYHNQMLEKAPRPCVRFFPQVQLSGPV